jgi:hypothetical protein
MILRSFTAIVALTLLSTIAYGQAEDANAFLNKVNSNHDKTISLTELNSYASKRFDALNRNGDKTLSRAELGDRISDADFKAANTGKHRDQTLSKREFIRYADLLFREANTKGHHSLSADELNSPAGQKLMKLLD